MTQPKHEEKERVQETLSPVRNFTITLEDRVRAAGGPPAYMRRKRAIEDLEDGLVRAIGELKEKLLATSELDDLPRALLESAKLRYDVREINRLIGIHNKYYPAEANLPIHPISGVLLERGQPWKPLPLVTIDEIVARVLAT